MTQGSMFKRIARSGWTAFFLASSAGSVFAQSYPTKQINIIVPLVPGTGMDVVARQYGERLSQSLGRPVIVENKPGASQIIAVNALMAAPADGHTLCIVAAAAVAINPTLFKTLPYDVKRDLVPIHLYLKSPFVLVVNPKLPVRTAMELIQYVRERPGKLTYSAVNQGSATQLAGAMMAARFNLDMQGITYKDTGQSLLDIAAGNVEMAFAEAGASQALLKDGRLRALAVSSQVRLSTLPDVPPFSEAVNQPDYEAVAWHMLLTRSGTPMPVVNRLHEEMKRIMATPELQNRIKSIGLIPVDSPSIEGMQKYIADESVKWGEVVRRLGLAGSQ
jgi:tripartite-type tricarboxylate transporter receptor subunit TctC